MGVTVQRDSRSGNGAAVVSEQQDYILREAHTGRAEPAAGRPTAGRPDVERPAVGPPDVERPAVERPAAGRPTAGGRTFVADEQMLFRYCALTFNTHRIHYDHPYATAVEGYPALVVNGNLTALMLTELFRERAGREPVAVVTRNVRPLFCGRRNTLHAQPGAESWRVWAEDEAGQPALEADIR